MLGFNSPTGQTAELFAPKIITCHPEHDYRKFGGA